MSRELLSDALAAFEYKHKLAKEIEEELKKPEPDNYQVQLEPYDAGIFGNGGGGNVSWWHDYIRCELERAHDFYQDQAGFVYPPDQSARIAELEKELEKERIRLAACGGAALSNTRQSAREQRITPDNQYWSDSYRVVVEAVDREMTLREANTQLKTQIAALEKELFTAQQAILTEGQRVIEFEQKLAELQGKQEPVCFANKKDLSMVTKKIGSGGFIAQPTHLTNTNVNGNVPLYTHPPRQQKPLSDDDFESIAKTVYSEQRFTKEDQVWHNWTWLRRFSIAIEHAHGIE